jgi:hypothetical protein
MAEVPPPRSPWEWTFEQHHVAAQHMFILFIGVGTALIVLLM